MRGFQNLSTPSGQSEKRIQNGPTGSSMPELVACFSYYLRLLSRGLAWRQQCSRKQGNRCSVVSTVAG